MRSRFHPPLKSVSVDSTVGRDQRATRPDRVSEVSGLRLATSDMRVAFMLMNEARYRALERLGVSREDANVATVITAVILADAAQRRAQWLSGASVRPTRADAIVGAAAAKEIVHEVAGTSLRDTPYFTALVAIALAGSFSGPILRRSLAGLKDVSHRSVGALHRLHRQYGHLIAPGARR